MRDSSRSVSSLNTGRSTVEKCLSDLHEAFFLFAQMPRSGLDNVDMTKQKKKMAVGKY